MQVWQPQDPFAAIISLSELYFRLRFIQLLQTKKVISLMSYGSSTSSWEAWGWVKVDLILMNLQLGIYTSSPWNNHPLLDRPMVMQFCQMELFYHQAQSPAVIVEQILGWEERRKSKRAGLWKSQSGIQLGKLRLLEIWAEFTGSVSSIRIG